jgi:hypothetical protein
MSLYSKSRKFAISLIDEPMPENATYVEIAKKLAERDDVVIDGIDLENKESARAFIVSFASRQKYKHLFA